MATLEITETRTVNATKLKVDAEVRHWEDAAVNGEADDQGELIPLRSGDAWQPIILLDTGVVEDWPAGTLASVHYKVCDAGVYTLLDDKGAELVRRDGYVPRILSPGGDGYGDYIIMDIDGAGQIAGWDVDLSYFEGEED